MVFKRIRWGICVAVAFLMGIPFVEEAKASGGFDIVEASIALAVAIAAAAGDS